MLPPIARQKKKSIHDTSPSKAQSPTPPSAAPVSTVDNNNNNNTPTRQLKATQAASIAAIIECTAASRNLIPGLADLFSSNYKLSSEDNNNNDTASSTNPLYHPALPSVDTVKNATSKMINDKPPFITMSMKDTAPQLKLENPPIVNDESSSEDKLDFQRQLVVKGGVKGYRMSRATQGVTNGCYYYEAVIGVGNSNNNKGGGGRGVKRSYQDVEENKTENVEKKQQANMNGHLRIGWSTREGDLQAPVGYNEHSYAIRDILGSRVHKSQREDKWGGDSFGVGDVLGIAICLVESSNKNDNTTTTTASIGKTSSIDTEKKDTSMPDAEMTGADGEKKTSALTNHIRFFVNGKPMGENGIAFDNVNPGTYHPAISCYKEGSAQLNFGPHFVYPPQASGVDLHPISEVCTLLPLPEEGVDKILSGDSTSTGKLFFSKKTDSTIESVFKEFIKLELKARYDAHMKHLNLHRKEIAAMRKERGLSTDDLND